MNEHIILIFYDLPMLTKTDVRSYTKFRKYIISKGFYPVQESFYCCKVKDKDTSRTIIRDIKNNSPRKGNIRSLIITARQFNKMEIIAGSLSIQEQIICNKSRVFEF